jgi:hypothetical protein
MGLIGNSHIEQQQMTLAAQLDKPIRLGGKARLVALQDKFAAVVVLLGFLGPSVKGQSWPAISFAKPLAGFKHPTQHWISQSKLDHDGWSHYRNGGF